ncbi:MAG: 2-oxoacid:acceptor oxidoreductase family protein [Candidatus Bathyarchaeota archaeon]|nr:2-oxoacid:acceptor oxidoreductase family protein [Candidatus Bathyarchaeota archaeon]
MVRGILISGTGGQGIVSAGELLSDALFRAGYEVVNTRSYGSEARGGSSRSEVLVSDEDIHDLQLEESDILIAMSVQAYKRFISRIRVNGLVLVDAMVLSKLGEDELREDVELVPVAAGETSERLGDPIVANMVLLGALAKRTELLTLDMLKEAVEVLMRPSIRWINLRALEAGYASL